MKAGDGTMTESAFDDDKPTNDLAKHQGGSHWSTGIIVILIIGLAANLFLMWFLPANRPGSGSDASGGRAMGSFELTPLVGTQSPVSLESLGGDVALINFWGTWCGPCRLEFPHLVELNDRLKSEKGFRFISVSCGTGGPDLDTERLRTVTEAYLAKLETDLEVYSDRDASARLQLVESARLSGFSYPTTVLLDRDGNIHRLWQGYRWGIESEMETAIRDLLES